MTETSTANLRAHLAEHLNAITTRGTIVWITSNGRRVAALVPVADAERIEGCAR